MKRNWVAAIAAVVTLAGAAISGMRRFDRWQKHWGATDDELLRRMPGDDLVPDPDYAVTRAITVEAEPSDIFPWLAQMGYRRGGLYSFDFLDRLFGILDAPSAKAILPEFQDLKAGDVIPVGKGGDFPVADLVKDEFLLLAGEDESTKWTWSTVLYREPDGRTRLVTRNRGSGGPFGKRWFIAGMDLAAFVMVWRWLHVLKGRAEALHGEGLAGATAATPLEDTLV